MTVLLVLLAAVVASSAIARLARRIVPAPLVQIALGALLALTVDLRISPAPEVFFLLFLAPLLFLDGWRISKQGLLRDKWTILALAFGLVLFTVLGAGFFIHWMIPLMPLPVGFALAAVLSPTDAVAVSAIVGQAPLPRRMMDILAGESLLNDASGLVCLRFATAAALTGRFSPGTASVTFVWLAAGGLTIGIMVSWLANATKDWAARHLGEETGSQILVSLLVPFGAYMAADRLGTSGILASVAAGIVMSYEEQAGRATAATRIRRAAVWDALQFASNGAIFVLLGQQLPGILAGAGSALRQTGQQHEIWLALYVLAITLVLALLRSLWAWATIAAILLRAPPDQPRSPAPQWRLVAVTSLAGVRGAVTLAGIMTLPLNLQNGSSFPTRDLAIFLAAGVIMTTLLAANFALPYLVKGMELPEGAS